ncbi:SSUH2-like protein [Labeo rohita]|uniref:SSUH2-like protein n=1 Tax=Labeo rohita TaxID=84645 RepID=A0A498ML98_LABRO|nr:SSUH2-like protein [Labeo rohita]
MPEQHINIFFLRKNQVFEFIPNRVPAFPLKKFEKVSGEAFFVDENLLRQTIELVPLTHVYYAYSGKDYDYFVFGRENKVHTTKYPSSCSIL